MTELNVLDEIVRYGPGERYALRAKAHGFLATSTALLKAADVAADARAARAAHDLLEQGLRDALRAAVLLEAAVGVLGSALDDDRDTLTDEEVARLVALRAGDDPRVVGVLGVLRDALHDFGRGPVDVVLESAVDDGGHGSPSVGRPGLVPQASSGSSAGLPAIMDPTVGAPTDAPAVPSADGASVERDRSEALRQMQADLLWIDIQLRSSRRMKVEGLARALVDAGWHK